MIQTSRFVALTIGAKAEAAKDNINAEGPSQVLAESTKEELPLEIGPQEDSPQHQ
jgi:hypothetical protein